jgi:preprotein translocase subunit SecY
VIEGLQSFQNIFKIPELKRRVIITLALLAAYRLGAHVPTPGIDAAALAEFFNQVQGTLLGMVDLFSGGNLRRLTVFALGIMPYISASIILQLLTVVIPALERLAKEGEAGKKKITQYTRYGTIALSLVQSFGIAVGLESMRSQTGAILVPDPGWGFRLMTMLTLTTGTALIMWLGEQISEKGIGNGISLIIFAGIVVRLPSAIVSSYQLIATGELKLFVFLALILMMVAVTAAVVVMQEGQRKIPVQYAKRVVGNKVMGGQSSFLPLKVNYSGVMPVIFGQAILLFPQQILSYVGAYFNQKYLIDFSNALARGHWSYYALYTMLIMFFSYFWVSVMFKPIQIADDLKKYGGYVPGVRPGEPTAQFLDFIMTRLTLAGAIFLTIIAVMPDLLYNSMHIQYSIASFFGGTGMLITVGVILDTMRQVETFLLQRHYDGFLKKGRVRARSANPGAMTGEALSSEAVMKVALPMLGLLLLGVGIALFRKLAGK